MELTLTKQQQEYLKKKGVISARGLKLAYKKSVQDQKALKKQAKSIKESQKPS